jgi:hypothetical protein
VKFKVLMFAPIVAVVLWLLAVLVSGEPQGTSPASAQQPSGQFVTTQRFEDYTRAHEKEHTLVADALDVAKKNTDLRLEAMNELRAQIQTERNNYQGRGEATLTRERTEERLNKLEQAMASTASANRTWTAALGLFFTVVMLALRFVPTRAKETRR